MCSSDLEVWFHLLNDVATRHGYPPVGRELYKTSWGQGIEVDVRTFYPRHSVPQIRDEYSRWYGDHLHNLRVMDGADEALRGLALPKAVITNSPTDLATRALSLAKLGGHFQTVVGCDQVAASKPAPDVVFEACKRLGVRPEESLVVGDSRFDEGAARAAGAAFVWFRSFAELRI